MEYQQSSDATWGEPEEIIPMRAGYDWRRYAPHAPFLLCHNGRPIEVQGKYGNWWRCCSFEPGPSDELRKFAEAMSGVAADLEALLREADNIVVWETAMPNGRDFQRRLEAALGIGQKPTPLA